LLRSGTPGAAVPDYHLAVMHGINLPLMMSVAAFVGGLLMYSQRQRFFDFHARFKEVDEKAVSEAVVSRFVDLANRFTALVENGSLQRYAMLLVASVIAVAAAPLIDRK